MRILLVEDEPQAAKMLAKGLREESYAVDLVNNGKSAVYQAAITEYDAIILDVMLPLQDGLAVCRQIRREGSSVPVLMLTARDAVVATFEMSDGARTNRVVPLSADAMLRLQAVREVLLPDGFTNYRVNVHGSATEGGLGRRYGAVTLRGDGIEWVGPE